MSACVRACVRACVYYNNCYYHYDDYTCDDLQLRVRMRARGIIIVDLLRPRLVAPFSWPPDERLR